VDRDRTHASMDQLTLELVEGHGLPSIRRNGNTECRADRRHRVRREGKGRLHHRTPLLEAALGHLLQRLDVHEGVTDLYIGVGDGRQEIGLVALLDLLGRQGAKTLVGDAEGTLYCFGAK
jgi:hypothetical protein